MRARPLALFAALAFALGACGTRVEPQVFDRLVAAGGEGAANAEGGFSGDLSGGDPMGDPLAPGPASSAPADGSGFSTTGSAATGGATTSGGSSGTGGGGGDATSGGGGGTGGGSGGGGSSGGGGGGGGASDVGVTADRIRVGNITTVGGPLGPNMFTPMLQGAKAYFARLNAQGGVNGRQVELLTCDDKADPDRNRQCARRLIEQEQVFALVSNATRAYAAADYVSEQGVPDVGGQPVGYEYFQWPGLFAVRGGEYPRNGEQVGYQGRLYNGTAVFKELKGSLGLKKAAVFYYNIPQSKAYGVFLADAARTEGYEVIEYEVNPALPSYDSYVADMQSKGVDSIYDSMDLTGNQNLCQSMQRNEFSVKAKVGLVSSWSRRVKEQFPEICKESYYVWGESRPYSADTENMRVFRETMAKVYGEQILDTLAQWHVEGWIGAKLFTDGVRRMGGNVTREGLIEWLNSFTADAGYGADGMLYPQSWAPIPYDRQESTRECISIAKWDLNARDFLGYKSFPLCHTVPWIAWAPAA